MGNIFHSLGRTEGNFLPQPICNTYEEHNSLAQVPPQRGTRGHSSLCTIRGPPLCVYLAYATHHRLDQALATSKPSSRYNAASPKTSKILIDTLNILNRKKLTKLLWKLIPLDPVALIAPRQDVLHDGPALTTHWDKMFQQLDTSPLTVRTLFPEILD